MSAWQKRLGDDGTLQVIVQRPHESIPYEAANVTVEDGVATWTLDETDTAIRGYGAVALLYQKLDGDAVVYRTRSVAFTTCIETTLGPTGAEPPDPLETWYQHMLEASAQAQNAAQSAAQSAEAAEGSLDKLPYPDATTGTWWIWDNTAGKYVDSGVSTVGGLPPGGTDGQYLVRSTGAQAGAIWQDLPIFDGSYEVTPLPYMETIMQTQRTYLDRDIVVKEIPYAEVTNEKGGLTATIGG